MTDKELKPCPNCGGQPKIHKTHKKFYVECDGDCWTQTGKHSYQEDAVKEWNTQIAVAKEGRQMTDHEFTDEEIIKALRCCDENDCYLCCYRIGGVDCRDRMQKDALALINRQKAEIERLQAVHADMTESLRLASEANKDMQAKIEKLGSDHYQILPDGRLELIPRTDINAIKTEAIKEFAERLKTRFTEKIGDRKESFFSYCVQREIDTLVKEMTEEHNESQNT